MIAGVVLAIGVILALLPLSISTHRDDIGCGSVLRPHTVTAEIQDIVDGPLVGSYAAACEGELSDRRMMAFPIVGVSALTLLFLVLTGQHRTRWDVEEESSGEPSEEPAR